MQTYDLVAIDIDGTLLDSQNTISDSIIPLLRAVEAQGTGVTLISGRPALTVGPLIQELGLHLPYVSSGGAQITDPTTGKHLASFALQRAEVQALAELGRAVQGGLIAMEAQALYYEGSLEKLKLVHDANDISMGSLETIKTRIRQVDDVVLASPTPLKFTISEMPAILAKVEGQVKTSGLTVYPTYSSPVYLEFTSANAHKGNALQFLAKHLSITLARTLVIGDSPNDLSMFSVAGTAVAMGNAAPRIKSAAHLIAPSNDEDGVAWVLREIVLQRGRE